MRTIFGNIISEKNLAPKENTEYIYNLDTIWKKDQLGSTPVRQGIIVENVKQLDAGDYSFNIKGESEIYTCSYGWVFIENTEQNRETLKLIEKEINLLRGQEEKIEILRNSLNRLFQNEVIISKGEIKSEK
jgi:hypothetical protein